VTMQLQELADREAQPVAVKHPRAQKARAILIRYFNMPEAEADRYFSLAAMRENLKVSEIENQVISLSRDLI